MNPVELFKSVKDALELDKSTIAAAITGLILGVLVTYWSFRKRFRSPNEFIKIIQELESDLTERCLEVLNLKKKVMDLERKNEKLIKATSNQVPRSEGQEPKFSEVEIPNAVEVNYYGTMITITKEQIIEAINHFAAQGNQSWLTNPKYTKAVLYKDRTYPPKYLLADVLKVKPSDFNTGLAISTLLQLGFTIVDKPKK